MKRFVKELCGRMGVPLTVVHEKVESYAADHGLSTEEAGRILRYRHLKETAEKYGCAKIAVAHHEDDDAETVLLNLFQADFPGLGNPAGERGDHPPIIMRLPERDRGILNTWQRGNIPGVKIPRTRRMITREIRSATSSCPG